MNDTEVKAQGSVLQVEAEKIKALVAKVDTEITAISQNWHGDDQKKFQNEWNTHKNELNQAQTLLQNMKTTIDQQVTEQVNTSSAY
ncbi:WXG100 family type VII secretion target [Lapillicoccus sp.]|uniref:WXG100 family type VII secretion target n=1 Tax=Lapillicoccus sp. TaxID=1909287 RepID=UPI0025CCE25A|nr:WXG100 family type VII secretion target [Lapillicoccus sp.]